MHALTRTTWKGDALPLREADRRLARLVDDLWEGYFADVPRPNDLVVGYAFPWKWRLARIRMVLDGRWSEIGVNPLLRHPAVPHDIYIAVLAHEIVHYAQGFGSPLPRQQRHAHAHGAVGHELAWRGLGHTEQVLADWGEAVWPHLRAEAFAQHRAAKRTVRQVPLQDTRKYAIVDVKAVPTIAWQGR
jgi:hypothetical protein